MELWKILGILAQEDPLRVTAMAEISDDEGLSGTEGRQDQK